MTRKGPTRKVDAAYAAGRLSVARSYLDAARQDLLLADRDTSGNPAISAMIHAAIAFSDALTARHLGEVNQQDHAAAPKLLRAALGKRLPDPQETRLRRILDGKDAAEYSPRLIPGEEARKLLDQVEAFAAWAEGMLA